MGTQKSALAQKFSSLCAIIAFLCSCRYDPQKIISVPVKFLCSMTKLPRHPQICQIPGCLEAWETQHTVHKFIRAVRGAEGTTWDGIPSESPPQTGFFLSFTITKMGWESLSLMMVMRWDGKHEEMH